MADNKENDNVKNVDLAIEQKRPIHFEKSLIALKKAFKADPPLSFNSMMTQLNKISTDLKNLKTQDAADKNIVLAKIDSYKSDKQVEKQIDLNKNTGGRLIDKLNSATGIDKSVQEKTVKELQTLVEVSKSLIDNFKGHDKNALQQLKSSLSNLEQAILKVKTLNTAVNEQSTQNVTTLATVNKSVNVNSSQINYDLAQRRAIKAETNTNTLLSTAGLTNEQKQQLKGEIASIKGAAGKGVQQEAQATPKIPQQAKSFLEARKAVAESMKTTVKDIPTPPKPPRMR